MRWGMQENPCSIRWFVFKLLSFSMTVRGWSRCAVACWWNLKSCCVLVKIPGTSHKKTLAIPCTSATYDPRSAHPAPRVFTAPTAARPSPSYLPATVHRQCSWDPEWRVMPPCVIVKETRRGRSWNHSVVGNLDDYWGKQCLAMSFLKNTGMLT